MILSAMPMDWLINCCATRSPNNDRSGATSEMRLLVISSPKPSGRTNGIRAATRQAWIVVEQMGNRSDETISPILAGARRRTVECFFMGGEMASPRRVLTLEGLGVHGGHLTN